MKRIELKIHVDEYESIDELGPADRQLVDLAEEALERAYAPYSSFYVGAAARLGNGEIVTGNNQENVAYPSGLCAERVAVFAASAMFPGVKIESVGIVAHSKKFKVDYPVSPCGACRQTLAEYESLYKSPIRVILKGEEGKVLVVESVTSLLPLVFYEEGLKIE